MDIASSIQAVTEEIVMRITKNIANEYEKLTSSMQGRLKEKTLKKLEWLQNKYSTAFNHFSQPIAKIPDDLPEEEDLPDEASGDDSAVSERFTLNVLERRMMSAMRFLRVDQRLEKRLVAIMRGSSNIPDHEKG